MKSMSVWVHEIHGTLAIFDADLNHIEIQLAYPLKNIELQLSGDI